MKSLEEAAGFHGHVCPGLAIGYRASTFALGELGPEAKDDELVAVVENDSCAVDAVQAMTGCTFGKGNLIFRDYGKQVYTFIRRSTGETLRISVKWDPPPETDEEREAWGLYAGGDRSERVVAMVHSRRSTRTRAVLDAPDEVLFAVSRCMTEPPSEAKIYPSVRCGLCGEKLMEPRARVRDGRVVCIPCFEGKGPKAPA